MWTDDSNHKFYKECQEAYKTLSETTDARGRKLKIHKVIMPATSVYMTEEEASTIDPVEGVLPRTPEDAFEPSYLNFLPINGAVLVPQFGDPNDAQALKDIQAAYPDREVIGIMTARSSMVAATSTASPNSSPRRAASRGGCRHTG